MKLAKSDFGYFLMLIEMAIGYYSLEQKGIVTRQELLEEVKRVAAKIPKAQT